jgi:hypothetical protein
MVCITSAPLSLPIPLPTLCTHYSSFWESHNGERSSAEKTLNSF